jgi:sec-independent protein translocase protein TatC
MATERDKELSLVQHLVEFRNRLMVASIAVAITTGFAFLFIGPIIRFLLLPSGVVTLQTFSPTEPFSISFRVALFAGIALAMPVILYEIYAYIDPALFPNERKFVRIIGLPVLGLFAGGMAFCYFILLPRAIPFLLTFGGDVFSGQLRAEEYLSFVTTFVLGMGLVFEVPVIIWALVRIGVVQRSWLAKQRRYVFLLSFVIGAIITPTPDPFNQTLVAIPMYLRWELGLFLARFGVTPRAAA